MDAPTTIGLGDDTPGPASTIVGPGDPMAGYLLESVVGAGGMGVVFRAKDPVLGRVVAVKVIAPERLSDRAFRELFVAEARAAAEVEHPNVLPVYQAGESNGQLYMAMRFVDGPTLATVLREEGCLPPARVIALGSQIAAALDAAHARGLVHGDVKPSNVLLSAAGGEEHAYLADFGLAGVVNGYAGTTPYLAPEVNSGAAASIQSDVYSLGRLISECLSGEAGRDAGGSRLPPGWREVLERATATDPHARHVGAGMVAEELLSLRHETVLLAEQPQALRDSLERAGVRAWSGPGSIADALASSAGCTVVLSGADVASWGRDGISHAQVLASKDRAFQRLAVLLPGAPEPHDPSLDFLAGWQLLDLRESDADIGREIARALQGSALTALGAGATDNVSPYPGLDPFDEDGAAHFYGRDADTRRLVQMLANGRFVAVLGQSGSGKSSLVRAGLIPSLRAGALPGSTGWDFVTTVPGEDPARSIAAAISVSGAAPLTAEAILASPDAVDQYLASNGTNDLLIVLDQFEEIFALCGDETARTAVIDCLVHAATIPGGRLRLVVAMRTDFYPECVNHPGLRALASERQFLVGPLTSKDLRRAIEKPARDTGLELEPNLARSILEDVGDRPGELPLLSHLLFELWRRRRGRLLTHEAYIASGGVEGAMARRAEEVYGGFDQQQREIAKGVLLRLTNPGDGTEDTRRRAPIAELVTADVERDRLDEVLSPLTDARLLSTGNDSTGAPTVEIAHEALIRGWTRLREWVGEERDHIRSHRRLTDSSREWEKAGRDRGLLARGARLAELEERPLAALNALELAYLNESSNQAAQDRIQRRRRVRIAIGGLSGAVLAVSGLAAFALVQRNRASDERDTALSRQIAGSAREQLSLDPELSILLSRRAYQFAPTRDAEEILRQAVYESTLRAAYRGHGAATTAIDTSPDGSLAATSSVDGSVHVWNVGTGTLQSKLPGHKGGASDVAFSRDGSSVYSAGADGVLRRTDIRDLRSVVLVPPGRSINDFDLAAKRDVLAYSRENSPLFVIDSRSGRRLGRFQVPGSLLAIAIDVSGQSVLAGVGSEVRLGKIGHPLTRVVARFQGEGITDVDFAPDGRRVLAQGDKAGTIVRSLRTNRIVNIPVAADGARFSPDGRRILLGGKTSVTIVDSATGREVANLPGHADEVVGVVETARGAVLTASVDGSARVFDWRAPLPKGHIFSDAEGYLTQGDPTHDGRGGVLAMLTPADGKKAHVIRWRPATDHVSIETPLIRNDNVYAFDPTQKIVASASYTGQVVVTTLSNNSTTTLQSEDPPFSLKDNIGALALSRDARWVVVGGYNGRLRTWNLQTGDQTDANARTGTVIGVDLSPNGNQTASGGTDGVLRTWRTGTSVPAQELRGHDGAIRTVRFSPDGGLVATGGADLSARLWDAKTGEAIGLIRTTAAINAVQFSPDGDSLVLATDTGLEWWDWRRGVRLVRFVGNSLAQTVSVGTEASVLTYTDASPTDARSALREYRCEVCSPIPDVLKLASRRVTRALTTEEEALFHAGSG